MRPKVARQLGWVSCDDTQLTCVLTFCWGHSVEDILYAFRFPSCMSSHLLRVGSKQLNSRTCVGLQSFKPNGEFRAIAWCQWTQSLQWSWRLPKTLCLLAVHSSFVDLWQAFRPFGHASFGGWDCSWHSGGTSCRELGSRNWCFDFARWTGAGYLAVEHIFMTCSVQLRGQASLDIFVTACDTIELKVDIVTQTHLAHTTSIPDYQPPCSPTNC